MNDNITLKSAGAHRDPRKGIDYYIVTKGNRFYRMHDEQFTWCKETFGEPGVFSSTDRCRWYQNGSFFYFLNEEDCSWFLMRWS